MNRKERITRSGDTLRRLRQRKALSQSDIAGDCGVTRGAIIRWEAMECEPYPVHRARYAAALGVTVGRLAAIFWDARS